MFGPNEVEKGPLNGKRGLCCGGVARHDQPWGVTAANGAGRELSKSKLLLRLILFLGMGQLRTLRRPHGGVRRRLCRLRQPLVEHRRLLASGVSPYALCWRLDVGRPPTGRQVKTDCCRSDLTGECRRAPTPVVGQFFRRLSAMPRNLTFDGGGVHKLSSESAAMFGQRLLPLAANGRCRPTADLRPRTWPAAER